VKEARPGCAAIESSARCSLDELAPVKEARLGGGLVIVLFETLPR